MSQQVFSEDSVAKPFMNVGEVWRLYDTVLITNWVNYFDYKIGWYTTYAAFSAATDIPFFNVRNRNHGLAYNNQETRDQLAYVMYIYAIGVSFFAPGTVTYEGVNPTLAAQPRPNNWFETDLPKHCSCILKTNQDERLISTCLYTPSGYGVVSSGLSQVDFESSYVQPNILHASFAQGIPENTNVWGFPKPLAIPRTANLSVVISMNQYARNVLATFAGPNYQPMLAYANDGTQFGAPGCAGIQVSLIGKREVQQRDQLHA